MRGAWLGLLLALLPAFPARAQLYSVGDFDFGLTETLYFDWHRGQKVEIGDEQYDYWDLKSRLNFYGQSRRVQVGLRLDAAGFFGPDGGAAGEDFERQFANDVTLEKLYGRLRLGTVTLEAGDLYGCLGKGIALCIKKVDELSTDTTLRGLKAAYAGRTVGVTALAGLGNAINVGDTIEQFLPDPNDLVGGLEVRYSPAQQIKLSAHGSLLVDRQLLGELEVPGFIHSEDFPENDLIRRELLAIIGPTVSLPVPGSLGNIFVEYDALMQSYTGGDPEQHPDLLAGHALYSSLNLNWKIVHLLWEVKWYESMLKPGASESNLMGSWVKGPSGEKQFIYYGVAPPVDDESLFIRNDRPYDLIGGRLRADVEVTPASGVAFVSYAHFTDTDIGPEQVGDYYLRHVVGGWEQRLDHLAIGGNISGGYRMEEIHFTVERMYHFEADLHFPVVGPHSVELAGRRESYTRPEEEIDYQIATTTATWSMAPWLAASFTWEYSDQPTGGGQESAGHFYSGELTWRFLSGSYFKLFGGSARGGLKCAGGMCRTFPSFEGIKGELTLRF